jgi:uncharacterized protein YbjT (DUF2867 family)
MGNEGARRLVTASAFADCTPPTALLVRRTDGIGGFAMRYRLVGLLLALSISLPGLARETVDAEMDRTLDLVRAWVQGGYDNGDQVAGEVASGVPDNLKHRQMFQIFVPVDMPNIPGYTVYQQASVDGSTDPDRILRNGVLQFLRDPDSGSIRERELNFKQPDAFHNAHFNPERLAGLELADFDWDPGCDFFLKAAPDGSEVRGPIGLCQIEMAGQTLTADDEVVIRPDEFWFLGRFVNADGQIMWGNASDEHTKLRRTERLARVRKPDGGVLIFGGTRNTGLELARLLRARGDTVTVFVRPTSDTSDLDALDARLVVGDALNPEDVTAALESARYTAIVTTLGCYRCEAPPDFVGNRNVFDAADRAGVRRVVMVSTIGAGDSADAPPWIARWFLKDVMALKTQAEEHLQALDLDYTIVRPGGLKTAPPTGNGELTADAKAMGIITRADLAGLLLDCLDDESTAGHAYTARDTEMQWPWDMW